MFCFSGAFVVIFFSAFHLAGTTWYASASAMHTLSLVVEYLFYLDDIILPKKYTSPLLHTVSFMFRLSACQISRFEVNISKSYCSVTQIHTHIHTHMHTVKVFNKSAL